MEERALDAYNQTLQQGISGIALVIAIGMVLLIVLGLAIVYFLIKRENTAKSVQTSAQEANAQAQENISDLISLQRTQQQILERTTTAVEGVQKSLEVNNELKAKQTEAFAAQENQLKAIHISLQEWPKAYTGALLNMTKSFNELKNWVERSVNRNNTTADNLLKAFERLEAKFDAFALQYTSSPPAENAPEIEAQGE
jgi:seryl-tRNA synthetase